MVRGTILATIIAVVATTVAVTAAKDRFDVAGDAIDTDIAQVKSGKRAEPAKGVHLDKPDAADEGRKATASDAAPVKAKESCGKATDLEVRLGVKEGSKVCDWAPIPGPGVMRVLVGC